MAHKWLVAFALLLLPSAVHALQLHWSNGSQSLAFTGATRCTLIVEVDSGELALPGEWRLSWVAKGFKELSIVPDTVYTDTTVAQLASAWVANPAEQAARVTSAEFQGQTHTFVQAARYILDLPPSSSGNLQAVSVRVSDGHPEGLLLRSPIVTFNGGVALPLPPTIISATSTNPSTHFSLQLTGAGLDRTTAAELVAPDTSWRLPLQITAATDSSLTASGDVPAELPSSVIQLTSAGGTSASSLAAAGCSRYGAIEFTKFNSAVYVDPNPGVSTKDFAFFYNHDEKTPKRPGLFHLMYIRHMDLTPTSPDAETTLAHAWSYDLANWTVDTTAFVNGVSAFPTDAARWDRRSVWAPSIVRTGNGPSDSTFMFYAGRDQAFDQSIGYATTADLDTCNTRWDRHDAPTWTPFSNNWMAKRRQDGRICRDPYVFQHPDSTGVYFLTYVALDSATSTPTSLPQAVGIARNRDRYSLDRWLHIGHYQSTDVVRNNGVGQVEGPMLFPDRGSPAGWILMFSNPGGTGQVNAQFERQAPGRAFWDTTLNSGAPAFTPYWSSPASMLWTYLGGSASDSTVFGWQGTEYLKVSDNAEYLAGFTSQGVTHFFSNNPNYSNGAHLVQGIAIARLNWSGRNFTLNPGSVTAVNFEGSPSSSVRFECVEFRPRAHRISWRISVPTATEVHFDVYDVLGRVERRVFEGRVPAGSTVVTWDTRAVDGSSVRSGMYYARLGFDGGTRVAAIPVVR